MVDPVLVAAIILPAILLGYALSGSNRLRSEVKGLKKDLKATQKQLDQLQQAALKDIENLQNLASQAINNLEQNVATDIRDMREDLNAVRADLNSQSSRIQEFEEVVYGDDEVDEDETDHYRGPTEAELKDPGPSEPPDEPPGLSVIETVMETY